MASVRGNVRDGCFFLDVESPPNDGEEQPRLDALGLHATAEVASQCIGLRELRDPRRPGKGAACSPRGEVGMGTFALTRRRGTLANPI